MHVLVIGASGFIGSAVVAALRRADIGARCVVRDAGAFARRFPGCDVRALDLAGAAARRVDCWTGLLDGVDAVVNAAGVLQPRRRADAWAVHHRAPEALFRACERAGVRRLIQISAIGVAEAETTFARSKRAGDEALMARGLDWTVLRPAVVVGDGSYGGTSLLRALAVFPLVTPMLGDGRTAMDIVHRDDLAAGIVSLLRKGAGVRAVLEPAAPGRLTLLEMLAAYRAWFGLRPVPALRVPLRLAAILARLGDAFRLHPVTTTALAQFRARLTGDAAAFEAATGVKARSLEDILAARPCESQDLWHARLYLLRPAVRLTLALLWAVSGLVGILADPGLYAPLLEPLAPGRAAAVGIGFGAFDLAVAAALLLGWRLKLMAWVQGAAIFGYTIGLTLLAPALWGDLYGGLLKNLPILALLMVHRVLEEER